MFYAVLYDFIMTKEEYLLQEKEIDQNANKLKRDLNVRYAMEQNRYKIGDQVEDHMGIIIVDKIQVSNGSLDSMPCCVYSGLILKKNGEPRKDRSRRNIYYSNFI
jgi:hypothetical protein